MDVSNEGQESKCTRRSDKVARPEACGISRTFSVSINLSGFFLFLFLFPFLLQVTRDRHVNFILSKFHDDRFQIYDMSSTSRPPVFPERLSAIQAFATVKWGRKKGRNWANRRCQHSKTKCKMPVGKRFIGLNLALIYLFDNTGCFERRPPPPSPALSTAPHPTSRGTWKTSRLPRR